MNQNIVILIIYKILGVIIYQSIIYIPQHFHIVLPALHFQQLAKHLLTYYKNLQTKH